MRTVLLMMALALPAMAAGPKAAPKAVPLDVSGDVVSFIKSFPCKITAAPGADFYLWNVPEGVKAFSADNVLTVTAAPDGPCRISVVAVTVAIDFDKKQKTVTKDAGVTDIVFGTPKPPDPGPKPPDPGPSPSGPLRALIVYETGELPKMPEAQQAVIFGAAFRGTLKDRCDKAGPDGRGWNIWDKDLDVSAAHQFWRDAMKRPRASVPFIHIFRGDKPVHEGPLPATVEEASNLITKHAGG